MKYHNSAKPKILIAEDDEENRLCLSFLLEQEGWEVTLAKDGKEAIAHILQAPPDVLILDQQMPEMTGDEVYRYLQLHQIKLAVVMISSDDRLEKLAADLGIVYYLCKPFELPDFLTMINLAYENYLCKKFHLLKNSGVRIQESEFRSQNKKVGDADPPIIEDL